MARVVAPVAGAVIGFWVGGPAGARIGWLAGSAIGNYIDPIEVQGRQFGDIPIQTAREGAARPLVFARGVVAGNIIDRGPVEKVKKKDKASKGGGPATVNEYIYQTYAIRICEPIDPAIGIDGIARVWENESLVYDITPNSQVSAEDNARFLERVRLYFGTLDQLPDPALEALHGVGDTPAYPGTAYAVFERYDLTPFGGSIPNYRWEVSDNASVHQTYVASVFGQQYKLLVGPYNALSYVPEQPDIMQHNRVAISPDGMYLVTTVNSAPGFIVSKFNPELGYYTPLATQPAVTLPSGGDFPCFDETGNYFAVTTRTSGTSERVYVYKRDGDTFTKLANPGGWWSSANMASAMTMTSLTGLRIAYAIDSRLIIRNIVNDVIGPELVSATTNGLAQSADTLTFSPDGLQIVEGNNVGTVVWDHSNLAFAPIRVQTVSASSPGGIAFSPNGGYIYTTGPSPGNKNIHIFKYNPATIGVTNEPLVGGTYWATGPSVLDIAMAIDEMQVAPDGRHLVVGLINATVPGKCLWILEINQGAQDVLTPLDSALQPTIGGDTSFGFFALPPRMPSARLGEGSIPLGNIIRTLAQRVGFPMERLEIDEVGDEPVVGFVYQHLGAVLDGIKPLQRTHFFEMSDHSGKLHTVKLGKDIDVFLDDDVDCIDVPFKEVREQAFEYPRVMHLDYQNPGVNYEPSSVKDVRTSSTVKAVSEFSISTPESMYEDQAQQIVNKMMKVAWEDIRGEVERKVTRKHSKIVCGTIVGLTSRGTFRRLRVIQVEKSDGIITLRMKHDRKSAVSSVASALPLPTPTPPPGREPGTTLFRAFDIRARDTTEDTLGYYVFGAGLLPAWNGYQLERSVGDELNYQVLRESTYSATAGTLSQDLPGASEFVVDDTNVIHVTLYSGEFESVTDTQLLNKRNAVAIIRADGTAEVIQFRDAVEVTPGEWELSYLIRGRLGSDTSAHSSGAAIVLLEDCSFVECSSELIGQTLYHRVTSYGHTIEQGIVSSITFTPTYSQKELTPENLNLSLSDSTLSVSWTPRDYLGSELVPIASVNLEGFEVTVSDGVTTLSGLYVTPSASFDVTGMTGTINVEVRARNRFTGLSPALIGEYVL